MDQNVAMANLNAYRVKVAPSPIHGVGLFALLDIKKGSEVMSFSYANFPFVVIEKDTLKKDLPTEVYDQISQNWGQSDKAIVLPVNINQQLHYVNFLNHSDDPNIEYVGEKYIAKKDILKGEEILIDFNEHDYNPHGLNF